MARVKHCHEYDIGAGEWVTTCLDCGMPVTYILEPYGDGMMATIKCTGTCGVSYDTNLEQGVDY